MAEVPKGQILVMKQLVMEAYFPRGNDNVMLIIYKALVHIFLLLPI